MPGYHPPMSTDARTAYCDCDDGTPCRGYPDNPRACRGCLPREHPWRHIAYPQDYRTLDAQRAMHRRYNPGAHHTLWRAWKWATTPRFGYLDALFIGAVANLIGKLLS